MRPHIFDYNIPSELTITGSTNLFVMVRADFIQEYQDGSIGVLCKVFDTCTSTLASIAEMQKVVNDIEKLASEHFAERLIEQKVKNEMKLKRA
ncbi:MAG TPA: hypothetical protein VF622_13850 [Segetibacter sp.]|jgi:hypothetical protein